MGIPWDAETIKPGAVVVEPTRASSAAIRNSTPAAAQGKGVETLADKTAPIPAATRESTPSGKIAPMPANKGASTPAAASRAPTPGGMPPAHRVKKVTDQLA